MLFNRLFTVFAANFGKLIINLQKYCFFCIYANNKRFFYQMRGFFLKSLTFYGFSTGSYYTFPMFSPFRFHLSSPRLTVSRLVSPDSQSPSPTDFLRTHSLPFLNSLKCPQKLIPRSFLPENQCSLLKYAEWHFLHFVHLGHFLKSLKCTKCTKCHMFSCIPACRFF